MAPPVVPVADLHAAMMYLARRFDLRDDYGQFRIRMHSQIESVAHELAHSIDLGCWVPASSSALNIVIDEMDAVDANGHELRVERIEVHGLRPFGIHVNPYKMAAWSQWRRNADPPANVIDAPLTKSEIRSVEVFIAVVTVAVEKTSMPTTSRRRLARAVAHMPTIFSPRHPNALSQG